LAQVFFVEIGVVLEQFLAIGIAGEYVEDVFERDAKAANAGLAAHFARFDGDPVEWGLEGHDIHGSASMRPGSGDRGTA
jgi:hypothetical protein